MAFSISPTGAPLPVFGSTEPTPLARMHFLISFVLTCAVWWAPSSAHADVYNEVNRLIGAGQWTKAQAQADEHLKAQPTDPQMRLLFSRIQDGQGQTQAALLTLQTLTQSFPELPEPHNNLAALLARENRYPEALLALQAAVRARPDYAVALENMGDVYMALGIMAYQSALQSAPNQPRVEGKRKLAEQLLKSSAP